MLHVARVQLKHTSLVTQPYTVLFRSAFPEIIREEYHSLMASVLSELVMERFPQFTHHPVVSKVTKQDQVRATRF